LNAEAKTHGGINTKTGTPNVESNQKIIDVTSRKSLENLKFNWEANWGRIGIGEELSSQWHAPSRWVLQKPLDKIFNVKNAKTLEANALKGVNKLAFKDFNGRRNL